MLDVGRPPPRCQRPPPRRRCAGSRRPPPRSAPPSLAPRSRAYATRSAGLRRHPVQARRSRPGRRRGKEQSRSRLRSAEGMAAAIPRAARYAAGRRPRRAGSRATPAQPPAPSPTASTASDRQRPLPRRRSPPATSRIGDYVNRTPTSASISSPSWLLRISELFARGRASLRLRTTLDTPGRARQHEAFKLLRHDHASGLATSSRSGRRRVAPRPPDRRGMPRMVRRVRAADRRMATGSSIPEIRQMSHGYFVHRRARSQFLRRFTPGAPRILIAIGKGDAGEHLVRAGPGVPAVPVAFPGERLRWEAEGSF